MSLDKLTQEIKYWVDHFRAYLILSILSILSLSLIIYGEITYFKKESKPFTVISKTVSNERPIISLKAVESGFLTDRAVSYAEFTNFNVGDTYNLPIRQADIKPEYYLDLLLGKLPTIILLLSSMYYLIFKLPPWLIKLKPQDS
jgi:hypothetical protein